MSRIGNKSIALPKDVVVVVSEGRDVSVVGPKGELSWALPKEVCLDVSGETIVLRRLSDTREAAAKHGLARAVVANMVKGVAVGFVKELEIQGVGFKAALKGDLLDLSLGFSHPIAFPIPSGIRIVCSDNTKVRIEGIDKQLVGQVAADIRAYYPPEPYKGKGVRYVGEKVHRKEGKTVQ
ncbi:MAG: hypothetical protein RLZZ399_821 [Verrucomicrobiota bacterium]|jgi:large subunit ribosomal protein L6